MTFMWQICTVRKYKLINGLFEWLLDHCRWLHYTLFYIAVKLYCVFKCLHIPPALWNDICTLRFMTVTHEWELALTSRSAQPRTIHVVIALTWCLCSLFLGLTCNPTWPQPHRGRLIETVMKVYSCMWQVSGFICCAIGSLVVLCLFLYTVWHICHKLFIPL